jgi:hypothetical protein
LPHQSAMPSSNDVADFAFGSKASWEGRPLLGRSGSRPGVRDRSLIPDKHPAGAVGFTASGDSIAPSRVPPFLGGLCR